MYSGRLFKSGSVTMARNHGFHDYEIKCLVNWFKSGISKVCHPSQSQLSTIASRLAALLIPYVIRVLVHYVFQTSGSLITTIIFNKLYNSLSDWAMVFMFKLITQKSLHVIIICYVVCFL